MDTEPCSPRFRGDGSACDTGTFAQAQLPLTPRDLALHVLMQILWSPFIDADGSPRAP